DNVPVGFPVITQSPTTKVVEMGLNALLSCTAIGSPTPIISWIRNMEPIDTSNPRYSVLDSGASLNNGFFSENLAISEQTSQLHFSYPKYREKMHGMSQPICRHPQQLL
ncbi:hypothetical protein PV326_012814, partial [Microctonus aethiopoides]